jgi:hypothetical protein
MSRVIYVVRPDRPDLLEWLRAEFPDEPIEIIVDRRRWPRRRGPTTGGTERRRGDRRRDDRQRDSNFDMQARGWTMVIQ